VLTKAIEAIIKRSEDQFIKRFLVACRYGVKYNKRTVIDYCFFVWFNDFVSMFFSTGDPGEDKRQQN